MSPAVEHDSADGYTSDSDRSTSSSQKDPTLDQFSLSRAIRARKSEFTRQETIRIKLGTWNVAAIPGLEEDIGKWFVNRRGICEGLSGLRVSEHAKALETREGGGEGGSKRNESGGSAEGRSSTGGREKQHRGSSFPSADFEAAEVGLYVLGLQEIIDVSSPTEALKPYTDTGPASRWKTSLGKALPPGYQLVAETQLLGLLLLVYAAPMVLENISSVSTATVGTGLLGYMGNKGAVSTRLVLGESTSLVFVNSHLAAGSDKGSLDRRNWDAAQIVSRTKFDPIEFEKGPPDNIGREDFAFWFGDLNYRLGDIPGGDVRQVLSRHTDNEYDKRHQSAHTASRPSSPRVVAEEDEVDPPGNSASKCLRALSDKDIDPHTDPVSLRTTIQSLLPHDQLRLQQQNGKAFHEGWQEGEITFLPTYKYDIGSVARFDSSEKHRGPSWCDRILYRTRQDKQSHERLDRELAESRKKDEEMKARGLDKAAADDNVLFDYDPEVDGADSEEYNQSRDKPSDDESSATQTAKEMDGPIRLEYYLSHQGIRSSDHKPLDAGFTLTFESVVPELKAKVHQEVVRELDKAENEARPGLTVVVDRHEEETRNAEAYKDPNALDFGEVVYDVPITRSLTVANTSGVPATFTFDKPNPEERSMSWLDFRISLPTESEHGGKRKPKTPSRERTLVPGEIANIEVTAHVQEIEFVRLLNHGLVQLEEILVLRVASGPDHFISAYGKWLPTCFGRSVVDLTRMPEAGARSLKIAPPQKQPKDDQGIRLSAPRELFRLTESIAEMAERAVAEWSMTRSDNEESIPPWAADPYGPGWPFNPETWSLKDGEARAPMVASVREALDTNGPLTNVFEPEVSSLERLEVLSETLMNFLRCLSDGVITADVWENMNSQIAQREKAKQPPLSWEETQAWVLECLAYSAAHSVSFTFVTFMLARIANEICPASSMPPPIRHHSHKKSSEEKKRHKDFPRNSEDTQQPSGQTTFTGPTPASTASFISSGSFRRQSRALTAAAASSASSISDPSKSGDSHDKNTTTGASPNPASNPMTYQRQAVETAYASIFSNFLISADVPFPTKEKERRALEERKKGAIEPFLKIIETDNRGPSRGG